VVIEELEGLEKGKNGLKKGKPIIYGWDGKPKDQTGRL
jgi:hypothetical protein